LPEPLYRDVSGAPAYAFGAQCLIFAVISG
jgi:hypothetical protein